MQMTCWGVVCRTILTIGLLMFVCGGLRTTMLGWLPVVMNLLSSIRPTLFVQKIAPLTLPTREPIPVLVTVLGIHLMFIIWSYCVV